MLFRSLNTENRTGRGRLRANDRSSDWILFPRVLSFLALSGMDIGRNHLSPISGRYEPPFAFTGHIERVTVYIDPPSTQRPKPLDD